MAMTWRRAPGPGPAHSAGSGARRNCRRRSRWPHITRPQQLNTSQLSGVALQAPPVIQSQELVLERPWPPRSSGLRQRWTRDACCRRRSMARSVISRPELVAAPAGWRWRYCSAPQPLHSSTESPWLIWAVSPGSRPSTRGETQPSDSPLPQPSERVKRDHRGLRDIGSPRDLGNRIGPARCAGGPACTRPHAQLGRRERTASTPGSARGMAEPTGCRCALSWPSRAAANALERGPRLRITKVGMALT